MNKLALAPIGILITLVFGSCSLVVNADRTKVKDDLYQPSPVVDSGAEAEPDGSDDGGDAGPGPEGAAGAAGASGAGASGAGASSAGAGGSP